MNVSILILETLCYMPGLFNYGHMLLQIGSRIHCFAAQAEREKCEGELEKSTEKETGVHNIYYSFLK